MRGRQLVRVYGDSLSLPRCGDGIGYAQTFPELMRAGLSERSDAASIDLYNRSRSAATAPTLRIEFERDCSYFGPDAEQILVFQCGICDCAPRPVPGWLRAWIGRLPGFLRRRVVGLLHTNRARLLRAGFSWRDVEPALFTASIRAMLLDAAASARAVLVLNVAPTTAAMDAHSPGFSTSIELYNALLRDAVAAVGRTSVVLVDVHSAIAAAPNGVERYVNQTDGHHITPDGHQLYCQLLLRAIDGLGAHRTYHTGTT